MLATATIKSLQSTLAVSRGKQCDVEGGFHLQLSHKEFLVDDAGHIIS